MKLSILPFHLRPALRLGFTVLILIKLLCLLHAGLRAEEAAPLIPMEALFRNPELAQVKLSPDGNYVAYVATQERRQYVFVRPVAGGEAMRIVNSGVRDLCWLNNERLAYSLDDNGKETWRIHAVGRDGSNARLLTPEKGVRARILGQVPGHESLLLVAMNQRDPRAPDLHRINSETGETELLVQNDRNYVSYLLDTAGVVRLATATDGINVVQYHRSSNDASFERVVSTDFRSAFTPVCFSNDNRFVYALSNRARDKVALVRVDPVTGEELQVVFEHPDYDVSGVLRDGKGTRVVGVTYVGEKPEQVYFDESAKSRHAVLAGLLSDRAIDFVSESHDGNGHVIKVWSDRDPGTFYHYDASTKRLTKIGAVAPWINSDQLATVQPVNYQSRDGLKIRGYLTRPKGLAGPLPTLLVIHGGPWARDQWRADPEIQFLANRGYAVLQINYRGSRGFGRAFLEAGFKQWGRAMQNDLTDGVHWLIEQKIADPSRIGIYGISYGGYATLAGLAFTPELFRCGMADSSVTDIGEWLGALPPQAHAIKSMLFTMVGDPVSDAEVLSAVSPLRHADKIRAPVLIVYGGNDPRVKPEHSEKMIASLTARGADVESMFKANEGHSYHREENKLEFYRRAERFLAKHLGGQVESSTPTPDASTRTVAD